jgi:hypothetical protein
MVCFWQVRNHVRGLLEKIGATLPEAIVYPAVAGVVENPSSKELAAILEALRAARPVILRSLSSSSLLYCSQPSVELYTSL